MKAWNDHKEKNGEAVSHSTAKEFLCVYIPAYVRRLMSVIRAAAGGFFIDRIVETKGLDAVDKYKAKQQGE
jgi:hypothetical protein